MLNLINQKIHKLTVFKLFPIQRKPGERRWICKCDCGNYKIINTRDLRGGTKSCGCLNKERLNRRGDNHHKWLGGKKNEGSKAWANRKLNGITKASVKLGYAVPYENSDRVVELHQEANGKCKICTKELPLVLDHSHFSGKLRNFLCSNCNMGLGAFCDSPELLRLAADYLDKHNQSKGNKLLLAVEELVNFN